MSKEALLIPLIKALGGGGSGGDISDVQVNGTSVVTDGVADIPKIGTNKFGVAQLSGQAYGIGATQQGYLYIVPADDTLVKAGISENRPLAPSNQHSAAFYGMAKAAGDSTQAASSNAVGAYTESAKSAISTMLNGSVSVSGSTPSITALPGVRYVCGECSTLTVTVPASGIIDVVFESGSTPTVLTVTPPTGVTIKWANGFDPTSLDANTTYEINIMDGFGVVGSWT